MAKTICIFGDSITWGAFDYQEGGWVARLRSFLETGSYNAEIYNCGISGDNTEKMLKRFQIELTARKGELVIFAIGINDSQYVRNKDNPRISLSDFEKNLKELINQAKENDNEIVFIGLTSVDENKTMPIPWDKIKYYDNENIQVYDQKIKAVCAEYDLPYLKMFDLLSVDDLSDGLHPNEAGHQKMFERIKTFLFERGLL